MHEIPKGQYMQKNDKKPELDFEYRTPFSFFLRHSLKHTSNTLSKTLQYRMTFWWQWPDKLKKIERECVKTQNVLSIFTLSKHKKPHYGVCVNSSVIPFLISIPRDDPVFFSQYRRPGDHLKGQ